MTDDGLGSLNGGLQDPEMQETKPPDGPQIVPVKPQPCNQATMMCLRGPCVHLWRLLLRFDSAVKDVMTERAWTCLASPKEEFDLNERLVYFCDRWWPQAAYKNDVVELPEEGSLAISSRLIEDAPLSRRSVSRPALHAAWEACLAADGYDFSWRDFDPTRNRDDDPDRRGFSAPGGLEAAREAKEAAELPPAGSIPEDDNA